MDVPFIAWVALIALVLVMLAVDLSGSEQFGTVRRFNQNGRSTFWCPKCQK